jgi:hypothetical protein
MEVGMSEIASKSALTPERKWIVELMQMINFGRIENLLVKNREPVIDLNLRVIRDFKFNGENQPRPELNSKNFELKSEVKEFFASLDQLDTECRVNIEVKHGLPFRMSIEVEIQL